MKDILAAKDAFASRCWVEDRVEYHTAVGLGRGERICGVHPGA